MTLIEGVGDEVTQFFTVVLAVIISIFAWRTTNITEQRHVRTVVLLDRRLNSRSLRRFRIPRTLTNHTETVTISGSSSTTESTTAIESEVSNVETSTNSALPKTPTDASTSTDNSAIRRNSQNREQENIIEVMDADQNVVRERRLAFYSPSNEESTMSSNITNLQPEELPQLSATVETKENDSGATNATSDQLAEYSAGGEPDEKSVTIKLKFINDDLKIVDGRLTELLGDFKKRHFDTELSSNKIVKLIFQGQVLKEDRQTLKNCGFFDNCVVHCLIHPNRTPAGSIQDEDSSTDNRMHSIEGSYLTDNQLIGMARNINNNNNQGGMDWDLGNSLFAVTGFILLASWYFMYVYAHLYTITATAGLVLITGIFSIVVFGTYFPDNEQIPHPSIRIARAERIDTRQ